jgi:hypothetical protein
LARGLRPRSIVLTTNKMEVLLLDITENVRSIWCHKVKELLSEGRQVPGKHKEVADINFVKESLTDRADCLR